MTAQLKFQTCPLHKQRANAVEKGQVARAGGGGAKPARQIARFGRAVHHLQQSQMARPVQQSKSAAIWSQMDCEAQLLEARARRVN